MRSAGGGGLDFPLNLLFLLIPANEGGDRGRCELHELLAFAGVT